ncbi:MAG TPA: hypothetical protein VHG53_03720 [Candidatus Limnocylindria bacterium]|nr:hypothetical protein [Candidatus Limnocylindria bacterium]
MQRPAQSRTRECQRTVALPRSPGPPLDTNGTVTLRYESRLRHIPVGRAHKHQPVRLLIAGDQVRIIREDGSLLRELTIDPGRDYQSLKLSSMT